MNGTYSQALPCGMNDRRANRIPPWKRILDLACIIGTLPALGPLLAVIAMAIKLVSKGPVFYRQPRVGYQGRQFTIWKFRTMTPDSDPEVHTLYAKGLMKTDAPMTKLDALGDPRLIPGGRFLRSAGLDELPQVINVLLGDMSLVGPRPCTPGEYEEYLPWQRERFNTLPGLTGLWQVSGKNKATFDEMVRLDIRYVRRRSLSLDLRIMLRTIPVLILEVCEMHRHNGEPGNAPSGIGSDRDRTERRDEKQ